MESKSEVEQCGSSSNGSSEVIPKKSNRATTAYGFFKQNRRSEMEKAKVHRPFVDFSNECSLLWNNMTKIQKRPFIDLANEDKKRHKEEMENHVPSGDRKRPKDPNAPKAPRTSFIWFSQDLRPLVKERHPDFKGTDISKELGRMWNAMEAEDKMQYQELYEKDKQRYNQEMETYKGDPLLEQKPLKLRRVEANNTDGEIVIERMTEESQLPAQQNPVSMCETLLAILAGHGNHSMSTSSSQGTSIEDSSFDDD